MKPEEVLPIVIVVEMFVAGLIYAAYGKWGSSIYWTSAAFLNFSVIFLIKRMG